MVVGNKFDPALPSVSVAHDGDALQTVEDVPTAYIARWSCGDEKAYTAFNMWCEADAKKAEWVHDGVDVTPPVVSTPDPEPPVCVPGQVGDPFTQTCPAGHTGSITKRYMRNCLTNTISEEEMFNTCITTACIPGVATKTTIACPAFQGQPGSRTQTSQHVCDGSNGGLGQVKVTPGTCTYSCTKTDWKVKEKGNCKFYNQGRFQSSTYGVQWIKYERRVCDGSNNGAGKMESKREDGIKCKLSPLVIDLDNDGLSLSNIDQSNVKFDMWNDGKVVSTGWVGARDAFLVIDRNGDGIINNRLEMFGDMRGAQHGFEDLALLDANKDGVIDANDPAFPYLLLWLDSNSDGQTQTGELSTLDTMKITSIALKSVKLDNHYINRQLITDQSTVTMKNGKVLDIYDVWFEVE